jgi:hypothetical protein
MIKVEGHQNLYRDEKSGAIVNCDSVAYNQYVNSIEQRNFQKRELDKMKEDINEIKLLLRKLSMNSENINI